MQIEPLKISRLKYEIDSAKDEEQDSEFCEGVRYASRELSLALCSASNVVEDRACKIVGIVLF
jgi:hypothetical protein